MNRFMVQRLVAKDWYFFRYLVFAYLAGAVLGVAIMFAAEGMVAGIGSIFTVTMIVSLGCHLVMSTVVLERKEGTLPFVMSLPVSVTEYTVAKLVSNLTIFMVPWFVVSALVIYLLATTGGNANGLIPIISIMLMEMALAYVVMLATALITESEGWTIVAMVVCNMAFSLLFMTFSNMAGIEENMEASVAVWTAEVFVVLGIEVALILGVLVLTFLMQNRKTDFL